MAVRLFSCDYKNVKYWGINNLYGREMSQNLSINDFNWLEETSQFNEDFLKIYNTDCDIGNFKEVDVQYPQKLHELHYDLILFRERMKIEKIGKLVANFLIKKDVLFT